MTNDLKPLEDRRKGYTPPEEALRIVEGMETKERLEGKVNIIRDESAADKGEQRSADEWLVYWNKVKDGRFMASMDDCYTSFKEIKRLHEEGTEEERTKGQLLLTGLRDDFDWPEQDSKLVSSTRIFYSPNNLESRISQHYHCHHAKSYKQTDLTIPVYRGVPISQVTADSLGLNYLQALFDTEDDAETIIKTLEFISGKNRSDIRVWTPPLGISQYPTRLEIPSWAAVFMCNEYGLHLKNAYISGQGRSRGVLIRAKEFNKRNR